LTTTGGDEIPAPVVAVHRGAQVFGVPEQPVEPAASNAYNLSSWEPTYTTEFATAGDDDTTPPVVAVHRGVQVFGVPEQPVEPAASSAYNLSLDPT
jgi:hypothetical protein